MELKPKSINDFDDLLKILNSNVAVKEIDLSDLQIGCDRVLSLAQVLKK